MMSKPEERTEQNQVETGDKELSYEELFAVFSAGVEKQLIRAALVLALFLTILQLGLLIPAVREALVRVERLEGIPFGGKEHAELSIIFASQEDCVV